MCAHKPCNCSQGMPGEQVRSTSVAELDELDAVDELNELDELDDADLFAGVDDVADWAVSDVMEDPLVADSDADQYTFGVDNRFQVRSQPRPPSTRLSPPSILLQIRPFGSRAGAFSGVLIAPRVVLTVKHGLFTNLTRAACGVMRSTRATRSMGRFSVCPGLDQRSLSAGEPSRDR